MLRGGELLSVGSSPKETERLCRVCLDGDEDKHLISPCRCCGSLKYIHEECLKTWLAAQDKDMEAAKCEICHTQFTMKIEVTHSCSPKYALTAGLSQCLFIPLLFTVLCMLFLIIYVLLTGIKSDEGGDRGYTIALLVTCSISSLVIAVLIFNSFTEACMSSKLEEWRIFDQDFPEQVPAPSAVAESRSKLPKFIRINGRKVETRPVLKRSVSLLSGACAVSVSNRVHTEILRLSTPL